MLLLNTFPSFFKCTHHPTSFNFLLIWDYLKSTGTTWNRMVSAVSLALDPKSGMDCLSLSNTVWLLFSFKSILKIDLFSSHFLQHNCWNYVSHLSFFVLFLYSWLVLWVHPYPQTPIQGSVCMCVHRWVEGWCMCACVCARACAHTHSACICVSISNDYKHNFRYVCTCNLYGCCFLLYST